LPNLFIFSFSLFSELTFALFLYKNGGFQKLGLGFFGHFKIDFERDSFFRREEREEEIINWE
jgi:hypothetical protein